VWDCSPVIAMLGHRTPQKPQFSVCLCASAPLWCSVLSGLESLRVFSVSSVVLTGPCVPPITLAAAAPTYNPGMKVLLFGATGMVGQGVLRECLLAPDVETVTTMGRHPTWRGETKLRELVRPNLFDLSDTRGDLTGFDACFYCLGVSSVHLSETEYRRVTYDLTLGLAETLAKANPAMTFVYVSGAGTDSSEHGRSMWARVKGMTENALLRLPFKAVYLFRPGVIVPLHGVQSKTRLYRVAYALTRPVLVPLGWVLPWFVTTTEKVGRAMLNAARGGAPKPVLETRDINALSRPPSGLLAPPPRP